MPGNRRWTHAELQQLRWAWGEQDVGTIAKRVGRTKTACYDKARELGLTEDGMLSQQEAARRSGFDSRTLLTVFAFAGVKVRKSRVGREEGPGRRWSIELETLERAVAVWNATAPVATHAAEHGVDHKALRRWLVDAGHKPPVSGKGREWRVTEEAVHEALALARLRSAAPKLSVMARAFRVSREKLAYALEAAGHQRSGRVWLVTVEQAREALEVWNERGDRREWWRRKAGAAAQREADALPA